MNAVSRVWGLQEENYEDYQKFSKQQFIAFETTHHTQQEEKERV